MRIVPPALFVSAALLWSSSLGAIDLRRMNDLGLVSVLPASFALALFFVSLSFALTLSTSSPMHAYSQALLICDVVLIVFMLYGTPLIVEDVPRPEALWRHIGVAEWIGEHGAADRTIDAYFNWPGFFIGLAFLRRISGLDTLAGLGAWAPMFFNLLYAGVLYQLFKLYFRDERLCWLGVWVFLSTNWVGADYLFPQAFGYLLYLNILFLVLLAAPAGRRQFSLHSFVERATSLLGKLTDSRFAGILPTRRPESTDTRSIGAFADEYWVPSPLQRLLLVPIAILLFTAVAISHQLTPYAIFGIVTGLVVMNASSFRALPLLMALIIFAWFTYAATPFLQQFLEHEVTNFGEVEKNVTANVTSRVQGNPDHQLVVYSRISMTALLWALAAASAVLRLWRGHRDYAFIVIGGTPAVLVALQSYGGEIALRIYFFALPATSFFVAAALARAFVTASVRRAVLGVMALCLAFLPLFVIARYGNERLDYFTEEEYDAVRYLYAVSPPGSEFVALDSNLPWRSERYALDEIVILSSYVRIYAGQLGGAPETIANSMTSSRQPSFLILTRAQEPFAEYVGGVSPDTVESFKRVIASSPRFRRIYWNRDAVIYRALPRKR